MTTRRPDRGREGRRALEALVHLRFRRAEDMTKEIDRRLGLQAAGAMLPWTVFDADGKIAGMTTYMNVDAANRRVEIGSTWYAKRVQRSALNTQCKLLLLHACVRKAGLHRGRIPHAFFQPSEPARHRAARRQAGRHSAQPPDRAERHAARHRGVQHHRQRMADGEGASRIINSTKSRGNSGTTGRKRYDGNVRLCDHRRGLRRQRADQPPERRCRHQHLRAGGGAERLASLHPSAGGLHQDLSHEEHQLGLPAGAGSLDRRPQHLRAARQDARRLVVDQRPHL